VQITANINGTIVLYPTLPGVQWQHVGPTMPPQCFKLPSLGQGFDIRFEMKVKHSNQTADLKSTEVVNVRHIPHAEDSYALQKVDHRQRGSAVRAAVRYTDKGYRLG
jgi:hypothetical protein